MPAVPPATPTPPPCALIADDQADVLAALGLLLKLEGIESEPASSPEAVLAALDRRSFDLVVLDMNYARDTTSGREGLDLIDQLRARDRALPVVGLTAWGSVDLAVEAMRRGLDDFVVKPWDNSRLVSVVHEQIAAGRRRRRDAGTQAQHARDLALARDVQRALVPAALPSLPHLDLAAAWQPARDVGGDYFDVMPLAGGRVALCIGDVMGKGVSAGLLMANLQALVRAFTPAAPGPGALCAQLNAALCAQPTAGLFVTFAALVLDPATGVVRCANAGHVPPVVVRAGGDVERLDQGGAVLGIVPGGDYAEAGVSLAPGDRLLCMTDGIVEATDGRGEEFGDARVLAIARAHAAAPAAVLRDALVSAVAAFSGGEWQDDVTLLVVDRLATAGGPAS
jgi:serine phosphatase RsbU (regulator of sigma subunit)